MRLKLMVVTVAVIGVLAIAAALATQSSQDAQKQLLEQMRSAKRLQPDTSSDNWKPLSSDIGLWLFTDQYGTQQGTLYVRFGDIWSPVALQGTSELGPEILPLGGR